MARAERDLEAEVPSPTGQGYLLNSYRPRTQPLPTWSLSEPLRLFLPLCSDVPKGAKTFEVSGSSEVKIYMVYDPSRVAEPAGRAHWPLDGNVDVVVVADTVSKNLHDLKVNSIQRQGSGGAASLYPMPSHLLTHLYRETQTHLTHPNTTQHSETTWSHFRSTYVPGFAPKPLCSPCRTA